MMPFMYILFYSYNSSEFLFKNQKSFQKHIFMGLEVIMKAIYKIIAMFGSSSLEARNVTRSL